MGPKVEQQVLPCSFCGEKTPVVCGPAVYICEPCAKLVIEIFDERRAELKTEEQYDGA